MLVRLLLLAAPAPVAAASFIAAPPADEAAIRAIITGGEAERRAPDMDWENAFGVRYADTAKHDAFYKDVVTPLQAPATRSLLEVRVKFVRPDVAVADVYTRVVGQIDLTTHKLGPDRWIRHTTLFTKTGGAWTVVLDRVADLRDRYYPHYDRLPAAAPVPPATLAAYAGTYAEAAGKPFGTIQVEGDHLVLTTPKDRYVVIPTSATTFLSFRPDDLAEYDKITFAVAGGRTTLTQANNFDEPVATAQRVP